MMMWRTETVHGSRVPTAFANEPCLRTDDGAKSAALEAPLLLALDDTDFVAGGLCAASSVQAAMRFWLHGHNELPALMTRCASASNLPAAGHRRNVRLKAHGACILLSCTSFSRAAG